VAYEVIKLGFFTDYTVHPNTFINILMLDIMWASVALLKVLLHNLAFNFSPTFSEVTPYDPTFN